MKSFRAFLLGILLVSFGAPLQASAEYFERDGGLYWSLRGGLSRVSSNTTGILYGYPATYQTITNPDGSTTTILQAPGVNDHIEYRSLEMDYGFVTGAAIGYTVLFPEHSADLRFELEGIYRRNENGEINSRYTPISDNPDSTSFNTTEILTIDGHVEVRSVMFNALVDFHTPTRFTPYLGLGIGASQIIGQGWAGPVPFDDDILSLSWQGIAGLGYHLTPGTILSVEYRYFRLSGQSWSDFFLTDNLETISFGDVSMGVRFIF